MELRLYDTLTREKRPFTPIDAAITSPDAASPDALLACSGMIDSLPVNLGVMDFAFMGGSMGSVVGEKISRLGQRSLEKKYPFVLISASGGARMQEGVLSLMQMAKASAILSQLAERRIPYVSIDSADSLIARTKASASW